mmetsp:Transcript_1102/g.3132  ORF Transcript_1102/g.3132 Transcript_1102/m.3132 type:complete len:220 (+) Transcript_1102:53-712(+)
MPPSPSRSGEEEIGDVVINVDSRAGASVPLERDAEKNTANSMPTEEHTPAASGATAETSIRAEHRDVRVRQLTDEQFRQLVSAFDLFDTDHSGVISARELRAAMRSLGLNPTREEIRKIITHGDVDGDGNIDLDEFLAMMALQLDEKASRAKMLRVFAALDRDKRGSISVNDLTTVSASLGDSLEPEDAEQMLKEADIDSDGRVGAEDFLKLTKALGLW